MESFAKVELTQGEWAIIDLDDVDKVKEYTWHFTSGYARSVKPTKMWLHWLVIGEPPIGLVTDHINRNRLDCRKVNLRHVTQRDNALNTDRYDNAKGITSYKLRSGRTRWKATTYVNGMSFHIGAFDTEIEALAAYRNYRESIES
jgi:hypothetical protein